MSHMLNMFEKGFKFGFCFLTPSWFPEISSLAMKGIHRNVLLPSMFVHSVSRQPSRSGGYKCYLFCIHLVVKGQFHICIKISLLIRGRSKSSFIAIPIDKVLDSKTYLSIIFIFKGSLIRIVMRILWTLFMMLFKGYKKSHMIL